MDPVNFRAQATGIGQTICASRRTGLIRAQHVVDSVPPKIGKIMCGTYPPQTLIEPMVGLALPNKLR